ncbi:MAG: hemolysin III family protein [Planctomycetaceae bacterium]
MAVYERSASMTLEVGALPYDEPSSRSDAVWPSGETANQLTHGFGLLLSLAGSAVMLTSVMSDPTSTRSIGCVIYLVGLVSTYGASTLSHSFSNPARRNLFRLLDQVAIFLLVAGSYTPFALTHVTSGPMTWVLPTMWGLVAIGIVVRFRKGDDSVAFLFYAVVGWMPALALMQVWDASGPTGLWLVLIGGAAYTGGLWFLVNDHRHRYLHAIWHLCTIVGSGCHFLFLQWYVAEWPLG